MAWLGEGLSTLKGQITNFTKEVLSDGKEDGSDEGDVAALQKKILELESNRVSQDLEICELRGRNEQLQVSLRDERSKVGDSTISGNDGGAADAWSSWDEPEFRPQYEAIPLETSASTSEKDSEGQVQYLKDQLGHLEAENNLMKRTCSELEDQVTDLTEQLKRGSPNLHGRQLPKKPKAETGDVSIETQLRRQLQAADLRVRDLEAQLEKAQQQLLDELTESQSSTSKVRSDLEQTRYQLIPGDELEKMEMQRSKQDIANRILQVVEKRREVELNLKTLRSQGEHLTSNITSIIQKLGDAEQQEFIHGALNALELENQVLRLRNSELEMCAESMKGYSSDMDIEYKVDHFGDDDSLSSISLSKHGVQEIQKQAEDESACTERDQLILEKQCLTSELEAMAASVQDLEIKVSSMIEENTALTNNLDELDQQHQLVIDQLLATKKAVIKENETLNSELTLLKQNAASKKNFLVDAGTDNCSLTLERESSATSEDQYEDYKKTFDEEFTKKIMQLVTFELPKEHNNNEELKCTCAVKALVKICEESTWKKNTLERKVAEVMKEVRDTQTLLEERDNKILHLEEVNVSLKNSEEALIEELMAIKNGNGEALASIPENSEDVEMLEQRIGVLEAQLQEKAMLEAEVKRLREERAVVARRYQIAEASLDNEENYQICTGQELQEALQANAELQGRTSALSDRIQLLEETEKNWKTDREQYIKCKEMLDIKSAELAEAQGMNSRFEADLAAKSENLEQALLACSELEVQNKAHLSAIASHEASDKICDECSKFQDLITAKEEEIQMAFLSKSQAESEVATMEDKLREVLDLKVKLDTECADQLKKIYAQEEIIKHHTDLQQDVVMLQNQLSVKHKELEDANCNKSMLEADLACLTERLKHSNEETASAAVRVQDIMQCNRKLESEIIEWKEKYQLLLNTENSYKMEISGLMKSSDDLHGKIEVILSEKENLTQQLEEKVDLYNALMTVKINADEEVKNMVGQLRSKSVEAESLKTSISLLQQQQEELVAAKLQAEFECEDLKQNHQDVHFLQHEVEKWKEIAIASEQQLDEAEQARASLEAECMRLFGVETKLHCQEHLEREVSRLRSAVEGAERRLAEAVEANERLQQANALLEEEVADWREQAGHQPQNATSTNDRIEAECQRLISELKTHEIVQIESMKWRTMICDLQDQFDNMLKANTALKIELTATQKALQIIPKLEGDVNEWKEKFRLTEGLLKEVVVKKIELERECKIMECSLQDMKNDSNRDCLEKMDMEKPLDDKNSTKKILKDEESRLYQTPAQDQASQEISVQLDTLQAEKQRMLSVLDEKIRENGLLKAENHRLMQSISAEKNATNKLQEEKDENQMQHHMQSSETSLMAKETIANLSEIIKNKDLEIETVTQKCEALDRALLEEKSASGQLSRLMTERDELIRTVQLKHQESLQYHAEIQRLSGLLNQELGRSEQIRLQFEDKQKILLNTQNELIAVKQRLDKLEQAASSQHLNYSPTTETGNVTSQPIDAEVMHSESENKDEMVTMDEVTSKVVEPLHEQRSIQPSGEGIVSQQSLPVLAAAPQDHRDVLIQELQAECSQLHDRVQQEATRNIYLQNEVQEQHEKESSLLRELERLRLHLVAVEESYTQEAVSTEEQIRGLQNKLAQAEDRIKSCSTALTSASVRANQHVESLQGQTRLIGQQRDDIQAKLSASEDQIQRHVAALTNLQAVLEQFQRDKDMEITAATARLQRELQSAEDRKAELLAESASLKSQLVEAKEGLSAAARLGEQLDKKSQTIVQLKEEVTKLQAQLQSALQREESASLNAEGKIDRHLVKNLLLGYLSAPANTKAQALRILGTILDFNLEERGRAGLEPGTSGSGGWLQSLLHPGAGTPSNQSLSEAFIRFLESESRPQPQLRLLPTVEEAQPKGVSDSPVPTGRSPILLAEVQLPTFTQFPVPRSSSSILKDVLKDS